MSRIGRAPITIPEGVTVKVGNGNIEVKGPKGVLNRTFNNGISVEVNDNIKEVKRASDASEHKALHGTTRANIANMVTGVTKGFSKELEVNGVGYRAQKQGKQLVMNLGYSHQVIVEEPAGITFDVPAPNKIIVSGFDKQQVGQVAAEIREKRLPEPYKGKGIKYVDEVIIRKQGKTGKGAKK